MFRLSRMQLELHCVAVCMWVNYLGMCSVHNIVTLFCVTCSFVIGWLIWVLRRCHCLLLLVCLPRRRPPSIRTALCMKRWQRRLPHNVASRPSVLLRRRRVLPRSVLQCHRLHSWWRRASRRRSIHSTRDVTWRERRRRCAPSSSPYLSSSSLTGWVLIVSSLVMCSYLVIVVVFFSLPLFVWHLTIGKQFLSFLAFLFHQAMWNRAFLLCFFSTNSLIYVTLYRVERQNSFFCIIATKGTSHLWHIIFCLVEYFVN